MSELMTENVDLATLANTLPRGGKRELARRLGCAPSKISDALDGFCKDRSFIQRLRNEVEKLLKEKGDA